MLVSFNFSLFHNDKVFYFAFRSVSVQVRTAQSQQTKHAEGAAAAANSMQRAVLAQAGHLLAPEAFLESLEAENDQMPVPLSGSTRTRPSNINLNYN